MINQLLSYYPVLQTNDMLSLKIIFTFSMYFNRQNGTETRNGGVIGKYIQHERGGYRRAHPFGEMVRKANGGGKFKVQLECYCSLRRK